MPKEVLSTIPSEVSEKMLDVLDKIQFKRSDSFVIRKAWRRTGVPYAGVSKAIQVLRRRPPQKETVEFYRLIPQIPSTCLREWIQLHGGHETVCEIYGYPAREKTLLSWQAQNYVPMSHVLRAAKAWGVCPSLLNEEVSALFACERRFR